MQGLLITAVSGRAAPEGVKHIGAPGAEQGVDKNRGSGIHDQKIWIRCLCKCPGPSKDEVWAAKASKLRPLHAGRSGIKRPWIKEKQDLFSSKHCAQSIFKRIDIIVPDIFLQSGRVTDKDRYFVAPHKL